ncbi:MAG: Cysteine desulfurase IscS 2 [Candidatus Argoarchaeum ethanivorans]|uniref:Cysteine desulfurase n=1 Tax=Candidatus Argoarchaeum ethanivorans TaxID=2608793 RepID=A0A811T4N7_9EURY|nr:MAG: Cysteine desulfurase IscS 2 [Candidatus Argoarchaeum ethanivorans]CAD6490816.1 MAG: Cysteine desulfurase IscS 2 [Candidatus Argoarchaeum ethanivorans]CAD6492492.1 MAG: Cysteine desulfurase IscS 2 [Candidatus Argoarchaeum ethanivorans]
MKQIYMDCGATTPVDPLVVEAMLPYFTEKFGNASSLHSFGREAKQALESSRTAVAEFIGAKPEEIIFTGGGTESDNLAIKGTAYGHRNHGRHIITSAIEHHAVLYTCEHLEKLGFEVTYIPVDKYGMVNPDDVRSAIREDTVLITIMHANNEIGTIEPVNEIGRIAKDRGIYFHTDAVQSAGKIPVNVDDLCVDLLSISAHKIYGPKGVGALYVRGGTDIESLVDGGGHERTLRSGTENIPAIVGFAKACELAHQNMKSDAAHLKNLQDKIINGILKIEGCYLNGHPTKRLPNNIHVCFNDIDGDLLLLELDCCGIAVSTGSACSSGSLEPSHVLLATGLKPEGARGSLRITLGRDNTHEDVEYLLEKLPPIIESLRKTHSLPE